MKQYFHIQTDDFDFLSQIAQGVGLAEVLSIAISKDLFTVIGDGKKKDEASTLLGFGETTNALFLKTLMKMGLLSEDQDYIFATPVAQKYLNTNSSYCSIEELQHTTASERFLAEKLKSYFIGTTLKGVAKNSCSSQKFNEVFAKDTMLTFSDAASYSLIIAGANYVEELPLLQDEGYLVILGEFPEADTLAATFQSLRRNLAGKENPIPSVSEIQNTLKNSGFFATALLPLSNESSCIIGAKSKELIDNLSFTKEAQLESILLQEGFQSIKEIDPKEVVTADWVKDHCRWGCSSYGDKCCPPNSPDHKETETTLSTYTKALLLEGEPPTRDFQKKMVKAENIAFKEGYYKAFAYWAGPCSLCSECNMPEPPKKCTATRPSMESAGIDVFATVRNQGYTLETREEKGDVITYFGLLLLK